MFESKYGKILTIILVIVIVAIVGLLGFLAYDYYQKYHISKDASEFVDNYNGDVASEDQNEDNNSVNDDILNQIGSTPVSNPQNTTTSSAKKIEWDGYMTVGTMEIPATNFSYPIIDTVSRTSIEKSVAVLYPPGGETINQPGNTVVIGHNYRNGLFFSNNKRLKVGDKIYVKDYRGTRLTYTIYNKFETYDTDTSFYQRETNGKAELTLSTCTDASNNRRLIILARQD